MSGREGWEGVGGDETEKERESGWGCMRASVLTYVCAHAQARARASVCVCVCE